MNNAVAREDARFVDAAPEARRSDPAIPRTDAIRLYKFMTGFGVGGTEKQVMNLVRSLQRDRYDLRFGCLKLWGDLIRDVEEQRIGIDVYPIRRLYGSRTLLQQLRFAYALRRRGTQIMHSYNFYANAFSVPAARLAGVPCVVASVRDMGVYLTPAQRRVQSWVCRLADRVVVNASAIRDWLLQQGLPRDKIEVIRNGVDLTNFQGRSDGTALRRDLGLPAHAPLVVMLARLNPQKGVDYFLEAAARVRQRCPDAYFLVVGDIVVHGKGDASRPDLEYRKSLLNRAERLGIGDRVRFTGMRPDVPELLSAASVSVLPSFSEGISNTLLESMAAGAAVVATHVGGTPEVVRNLESGLLVPPRDAQAIADAICAILENPFLAATLSGAGRERVHRAFSLDRMVRRTEDLYMDLLGPDAPEA